jgi:Gly-Xaa carboxypeptidase
MYAQGPANQLTTKSPFLTTLLCASEHAPSFPSRWARLLRRPSTWGKFVKEFAAESLANKAILGTTQAVDVIQGGVKVNALPELVTAQINHRVDFSEDIDGTKKHVAKVVQKVAKRFGQDFYPFSHSNASHGVKLDVFGIPIEPAPLTPAKGGVWDLFAGTVRQVACQCS